MADGETVVLPFGFTVPTLGVMLTCVAPFVLQLNVLDPPGAIFSGLPSKRTICTAPVPPTVTVCVALMDPDPPVAVRV